VCAEGYFGKLSLHTDIQSTPIKAAGCAEQAKVWLCTYEYFQCDLFRLLTESHQDHPESSAALHWSQYPCLPPGFLKPCIVLYLSGYDKQKHSEVNCRGLANM
jgi:hypothetical protein